MIDIKCHLAGLLVYSRIKAIDEKVIGILAKHGHWMHRVSLGLLFVWFGLLKPFGHETATSLLARAIYWGDPEYMVVLLGWWEVVIGVSLIFHPLLRLAVFLMGLRLIGIVLTFFLETEVCFYQFPFTPTPEGQYMIKDLVVFFAALAIAGGIGESDGRKPDVS